MADTTRVDTFLRLGRRLVDNPHINYIWDSQHWDLGRVLSERGANCWTSLNAVMLEVSRDEGLGYDSLFGTTAGQEYLVLKQPYRDDVLDFRGMSAISKDYDGSQDKSHVGVTFDHAGRFLHCHDSGWNAGMTLDENSEVANQRWLRNWPGWDGYLYVGAWPLLGVDLDPEGVDDAAKASGGTLRRLHPMWYAHPALLAMYFAHVARLYGLPEEMPVACSMREIGPSAWTPGDLLWREVYGWSSRVDHNSLGPFQQQSPLPMGGEAPRQRNLIGGNNRLGKPGIQAVEKDPDLLREAARQDFMGDQESYNVLTRAAQTSGLGVGGSGSWYWGRPEQVMDITYSVHRFCREAVKYRSKYAGERATPQMLTRWIADVQRPRADLRGAYAEFVDDARRLIDLGYSAIPNSYRPADKVREAGVLVGSLN